MTFNALANHSLGDGGARIFQGLHTLLLILLTTDVYPSSRLDVFPGQLHYAIASLMSIYTQRSDKLRDYVAARGQYFTGAFPCLQASAARITGLQA